MLTFVVLLDTAMAMWPSSWITGEACGKISRTLFNCSEIDYQCFCGNISYLGVAAQCIVSHTNKNTTSEGEAWNHFIKNYCQLQNADPVIDDLFEVLETHNDSTMRVDEFQYLRGYRAMYNQLEQKDISAIQGGILVVFWLAIPLVFGLMRLFKWAVFYLGPSETETKPSKWEILANKHIFTPALWRNRHMTKFQVQKFSFSVGTRWETLLCSVYILLSLIFCLCPYTFMDYDPFYETRWKQMMRYGSDRTGIIATLQFPVLILFATRNNILIWISGWSYSTFNRYHRAISRICYALLIVHAVLKHIFAQSYGASLVLYFYPIPYYRYGVAAMFLFAIMIFSAQLRQSFYEVFLSAHLLCAFFGVVMSILHLRGIGYQQPLYICLGLWGLDMLIRLLRIYVFNFSILLRPLVGHRKISYGTMKTYHHELTHIRVKLPVKWHFSPGQYAYIHLSPFSFLTGGHPFSVVEGSSNDDCVNIVFKSRSGFTKLFKDRLAQYGCDEDMPVTMPVFVEGPYGVSAPVERYGEAIIFAGGIGITGVLGYAAKLAKTETCSRITVVWCVPKRDDFKPFAKHISQLLKVYPIEFQLYCRGLRKEAINMNLAEVLTSCPIKESGRSNATKHENFSSTSTLGFYHDLVNSCAKSDVETICSPSMSTSTSNYPVVLPGRPNIPEILLNFFSQSLSSVCVVSCGPASMVDQVREYTSKYMHEAHHGKVEYFEEAFEW